jgi:hypothetical protein
VLRGSLERGNGMEICWEEQEKVRKEGRKGAEAGGCEGNVGCWRLGRAARDWGKPRERSGVDKSCMSGGRTEGGERGAPD